ncbi:MAG TPA: YfcC family protein [Negativicutes bacterium]|nr:YfcC family protein [Negativicutes bacterium]
MSKQECTIGPNERKSKFKMPHVFTLLFFIVLVTAICTWIIPPGAFNYQDVKIDGNAAKVVIPGSFHLLPRTQATQPGLVNFMSSFHKGMVSAANLMVLIFIVNSAFTMVIKTGSFHAMLGALLRKFEGKEKIIIPVFLTIFALGSTLFGMCNEYNGLIPIFVGLGTAIGYDAMVGFAIVELGIAVGFASSLMNPFTTVVAQSLAGVPLYSGMEIRVANFVIFAIVSVWWILRYGNKVRKDPTKSIMYGEKVEFVFEKDELKKYTMERKHKLVLLEVLAILVFIFYGFLKKGYGMPELSGTFLLMGIIAALIDGWNTDKIATEFLAGCAAIINGALIVGFAKAILVIMQEGMIVDTIINAMANLLNNLPPILTAQGMLVVQTLVDFIIPSGSGQAAVVIPILAPVGNLVGVSGQVTVLAYLFGSSFADFLYPTATIAIGCGISGIPLNKWWQFFFPLFAILYAVQMIIITVVMAMGI